MLDSILWSCRNAKRYAERAAELVTAGQIADAQYSLNLATGAAFGARSKLSEAIQLLRHDRALARGIIPADEDTPALAALRARIAQMP
ncbi:MAG: hypothetical protein LBC18_03175 [Opitutaceae bacterium]|nr:hypothetical protein [Opitutaceae bacterium]